MDESVVHSVSAEIVEAQERAGFDIQIATAKKFPRTITSCVNNSIAIATMNEDMAKSCGYALPRAGMPIQGPSVHLARILVGCWGNVRAESKIIRTTHDEVVSQGICFDLETNTAVKVEVSRKITGRNGRFSDDMINMTKQAAKAVAYRNAVFSIIPKSVIDSVYKATRDLLIGDLSDEVRLIKARDKAFKHFKDTYNATEQEVLKAIGLASINAVDQNHIVLLRDIEQAIKDADTTPDEVFSRLSEKDKKDKKVADEVQDALKKQVEKKTSTKTKPTLNTKQ